MREVKVTKKLRGQAEIEICGIPYFGKDTPEILNIIQSIDW